MTILDKEQLELIAHDLNNPLSALMANLGYISSVLGYNPDAKEAVEDCILTQQTLKRLVENLNALARLESGDTVFTESTPVKAVLTGVEGTMKLHAEPSEVGLSVVCAAEAGLVNGSAKFLTLALENLVSTSLVHAPTGSTIELRGRSIDADRAGLAVVDDGPIVPEELRPLVLKKETQVKLKIPQQGARYGRGFGLYITALVAKACGGSLEIGEDERGRCVFELCLPKAS